MKAHPDFIEFMGHVCSGRGGYGFDRWARVGSPVVTKDRSEGTVFFPSGQWAHGEDLAAANARIKELEGRFHTGACTHADLSCRYAIRNDALEEAAQKAVDRGVGWLGAELRGMKK